MQPEATLEENELQNFISMSCTTVPFLFHFGGKQIIFEGAQEEKNSSIIDKVPWVHPVVESSMGGPHAGFIFQVPSP